MLLKQTFLEQIIINKMKNNNKMKNFMVVIQISILIISLVAFTNIVSAQPSSAPLSTSVARKVVIKSNVSQEVENSEAPITGAVWSPFPGLSGIGEWGGELVSGFFSKIGGKIGNTVASLGIVVLVWVATYAISWAVTKDFLAEENLFWANAAGASLGLGFTAGSLSGGFAAGLGATGAWIPFVGWTVGIITAVWIFWRSTLRVDQRAVVFDCKPWQSQTGGDDCEECNDGEFPCTEYKCKSLGQSCELVNEGDNARCIYNNSRDTTAPSITARTDSLLSADYSYDPLPAAATNGVEIKYKGGCLPSFESFTYGIELDKTGMCKMWDSTTASFSDMPLPFGSGGWEKNHTQLMFFPGQAQLDEEGAELPGGGNYEYYIRCQSVNGNANVGEFLFKFCIDPDPDTFEPDIQGFNLLDRTPLRYFSEDEAHETQVTIYVKEPLSDADGGCKWSHSNKAYKDMEGIMTSCSDNRAEFTTFNAQLSYTCSGTLTGLQNDQENKFYFRCNDTAGNVNTQSKELTLIGSRPLVIDFDTPSDEIIKGSSEMVQITLEASTSAGYENGKADCYYSDTGDYNDYTKFMNTRSHEHSDNSIYLPEDTYTYYVQCFDMAGNVDIQTIEFEVEADFEAPTIVRIYHEGGDLKLVTSEEAECVYDTRVSTGCSFIIEDGTKITSSDNIIHSVSWNTNNNLYVKCKDLIGEGNYPDYDKCSIIVRPFEIF